MIAAKTVTPSERAKALIAPVSSRGRETGALPPWKVALEGRGRSLDMVSSGNAPDNRSFQKARCGPRSLRSISAAFHAT